jgi:DNA-binding CsgD family transcriptional regulator
LSSQIASAQSAQAQAIENLQNEFLKKEQRRLKKEHRKQLSELKQYGAFYTDIDNYVRSMEGTIGTLLQENKLKKNSEDGSTEDSTYQFNEQTRSSLLHIQSTLAQLSNRTTRQVDESVTIPIHADFKKQLSQRSSSPLTELELQVASLTRSGLATKQMPKFLRRSEHYLYHVRQSLKQKLGLQKKQNLKKFLMELE